MSTDGVGEAPEREDTAMTGTTNAAVRGGMRAGSGRIGLVLRLLPAGMAAMVLIDRLLGDRAEYFHAGRLLQAWGNVLRGESIDTVHFIVAQEEMGSGLALLAGSVAFVLEPAAVLAVVVFGGSGVSRVLRSLRRVAV